jgi:hypothetical protein
MGNAENPSGETEETDQQFADLRSVISYLRKEKEISELHLEVSKQEAARSKAEVDHLTRVLDETRSLLTEVYNQFSFLPKLIFIDRNANELLKLQRQPLNMLSCWSELIKLIFCGKVMLFYARRRLQANNV